MSLEMCFIDHSDSPDLMLSLTRSSCMKPSSSRPHNNTAPPSAVLYFDLEKRMKMKKSGKQKGGLRKEAAAYEGPAQSACCRQARLQEERQIDD